MKCEWFLVCVAWVHHLLNRHSKSTCLIIVFWSGVQDRHLFMIHQHPFISGGTFSRMFHTSMKGEGMKGLLALTLRPDIHYIIHDDGCQQSCTRSPPWTWTTSDRCVPTSSLDLFKHHRLQLCSEWRLTVNIHGPFEVGTCWNWNRPACFYLQYLK